MVDVLFKRRLKYFVPLALLQLLAGTLTAEQRAEVAYLTDAHLESIREMPLLHRSRLSVQVRIITDAADASPWMRSLMRLCASSAIAAVSRTGTRIGRLRTVRRPMRMTLSASRNPLRAATTARRRASRVA